MSAPQRSAVRDRAEGRCEYCRFPDLIRSGPFAVEHIFPRSRGGDESLDNLAWSCNGCNGHKAAALQGIDQTTGEFVSLFHPRNQKWAEHFTWSDDQLTVVGRTATGRASIERLRLNREPLMEARRLLKIWKLHP